MAKQLTTARMKKNFPLWKRKPGFVYRDEGNMRLGVAWIDKGEYSATIFDTATQKYLFRENCDVVSLAMGMTLLDRKVKQLGTVNREVKFLNE